MERARAAWGRATGVSVLVLVLACPSLPTSGWAAQAPVVESDAEPDMPWMPEGPPVEEAIVPTEPSIARMGPEVKIGALQPIDPSGAVKGALVTRPSLPDTVVTFSAPGPVPSQDAIWQRVAAPMPHMSAGPRVTHSFSIRWQSTAASTEVLLCDLDPAQQWYVSIGGVGARPLMVDPQGTGRVTVPGTGSQLMRVTAGSSGPGAEPVTPGPVPARMPSMPPEPSLQAPAVPNDGVPPIVSDLRAVPSPLGATLTWTTTEPALCVLDVGPTTAYGRVIADGNVATTHQAVLVDLRPGEYHFRVSAADDADNSSSTADQTFIVPASSTLGESQQ